MQSNFREMVIVTSTNVVGTHVVFTFIPVMPSGRYVPTNLPLKFEWVVGYKTTGVWLGWVGGRLTWK